MGIEVQRTVESIQVGARHRADLGDIQELADSIQQHGLLQPITVTPEGVLVCGRRRLEAIRLLKWRTVGVWVRSGVSTRLGHLLAEQDENAHRKPLTQLEAAALYRELKQLMTEDAQRRDVATRFSAQYQPRSDGGAKLAPPSAGPGGKSRAQAARMVTGRASYTTLEKIEAIQAIAESPAHPEALREQASIELAGIEAGDPVDPAYQRIRAAAEQSAQSRQAELHAMAEEAVARVTGPGRSKARTTRTASPPAAVPGRWPVTAFVQTWTSLADWWTHYDPDDLARDLTDEQASIFLDVADGTSAFAARLRTLLDTNTDTDAEAENEEAGEDGPPVTGAVEGDELPRRHLRVL